MPGGLPDNIRHTHFSRNPKIAQYLKAYKYVKEFGEDIDRICSELETKGCTIPSFHVDAFILKATLMAEWTKQTKDVEDAELKQVLKNTLRKDLGPSLYTSCQQAKKHRRKK